MIQEARTRMSPEFILFDLDQTLYSHESGLQQEIGRRIQMWVCDFLDLSWDEAGLVRRDYFERYGTTLNGLVIEKDINADGYLAFVHDVPVEAYLKPDPSLGKMLAALPLRRVVYTNATKEYSRRVLSTLGVEHCFERVIGIEDVGLCNKLYKEGYERALALLGAQGDACIMIEDSVRNLAAAKGLGLSTVLLRQNAAQGPRHDVDENVDFVVSNVLDVGKVVQDLLDDDDCCGN
jgi:putative hydrolase of the HAD superfamily